MLRLTTPGSPRLLPGLSRRLSDTAGLLSPLAEAALEAVRRNFSAGGRPEPWVPLAESTLKGRRGRGARPLGKPLIDTGRLMGSIRAVVAGGRLVLSTSLPYAAVQQLGGRAGRFGAARIPARPYLVLPADEVKRLAELLAAQLEKAQLEDAT